MSERPALVQAGVLTIALDQLIGLTSELSTASLTGLWKAVARIETVPTLAGPQPGWASWTASTLHQWGMVPSAARKAAAELGELGFVTPQTHPETRRKYAIAGPRIRTWFAPPSIADGSQVAWEHSPNPPKDSPIRHQSPTPTSTSSSSGISTTDDPPDLGQHHNLLRLLQNAPATAAEAALSELLARDGSAPAWQPWTQHPTLGSEVGTGEGLARTILGLIADPARTRDWCQRHGIQAHSTTGLELLARVVFALVVATAPPVRTAPGGWIGHCAKANTRMLPSAQVSWLEGRLRSRTLAPARIEARDAAATRQPARHDHTSPTLAQVHELPKPAPALSDDALQALLRIPSMARHLQPEAADAPVTNLGASS